MFKSSFAAIKVRRDTDAGRADDSWIMYVVPFQDGELVTPAQQWVHG